MDLISILLAKINICIIKQKITFSRGLNQTHWENTRKACKSLSVGRVTFLLFVCPSNILSGFIAQVKKERVVYIIAL